MCRKALIWALVCLSLCLVAGPAQAFDGQRKGFILGVGAGLGHTSFTQEETVDYWGYSESVESDREDKAGVMTDFKIGYAWDNYWAVYYTAKVSWFGMENVYGEDVTIANGLEAVALTHLFKPQAPSWFVAGGLGYSTWGLPFEDNPPDTWYGPGLFMGGGYEFSRHWSVEGYLAWGKPNDTEWGVEVSAHTFSIMLTVNVLGY
jgi:hypothetical protein